MMQLAGKNTFRNQQGMSMIQVMIVIGVFSVSSYIMSIILTNLWQSNTTTSLSTTVKQLQLMTFGNIAHYESWQKTIGANGSLMNCLKTTSTFAYEEGITPPPCPAGTSGSVAINVASAAWDPGNTEYDDLVVDKTPNMGFSTSGLPCDTFDAVNGNDQCPIRIEVYWQTQCPASSTCTAPLNLMTVTFLYRPQNVNKMPPINPTQYNLPQSSRLTLAVDSKAAECGMEGKVYGGGAIPPNTTTFYMPNGTYYTDIRGCLPIEAMFYKTN